jgi:Bacterial TSP3 repeat
VSYAETHSPVSAADGGSPAADMAIGAAAFPSGGRLLDTDGDGLGDRLEHRMSLDPHNADTDGDLLSDSFELLFSGTDPLAADTTTDGSWYAHLDNVLLSSDEPGPVDHAHDLGGAVQPPDLGGLPGSAGGGFEAGHDDHVDSHGIALMPDGFDHAGQPEGAHHLNDIGHVGDWGDGDDDHDGHF